MEEIWKDIKGYEGLYQVSNMGEVRVLKRHFITHGKDVYQDCVRLLSPKAVGRGYLATELSMNGTKKKFYIHRLVAEAFVPNVCNKPQVDHVNRNKLDNRADNLRWVTNKENHLNMDRNTLFLFNGEEKPLSVLAEERGLSRANVNCRLLRGWSLEEALTTPKKRGAKC